MPMNNRVMVPRASGFSPKSFSGLANWWDAADAASVTISTGVSQWSDKSGNAGHATQGTGNNQPTYTTSGLNGRNVLTFDGVNDSLSFTGTARLEMTLFAVTRLNLGGPGLNVTSQLIGDASSGFGLSCIVKNDGGNSSIINYMGGFAGANTCSYSLSGSVAVGPIIISSRASAANGGVLYTNGTQRATCTTPLSHTLARIGIVGSSFPLNGYMTEVIVYSRELSLAEHSRVISYLGTKWGITVA